jgi:hypothetical protein
MLICILPPSMTTTRSPSLVVAREEQSLEGCIPQGRKVESW